MSKEIDDWEEQLDIEGKLEDYIDYIEWNSGHWRDVEESWECEEEEEEV